VNQGRGLSPSKNANLVSNTLLAVSKTRDRLLFKCQRETGEGGPVVGGRFEAWMGSSQINCANWLSERCAAGAPA
jgi:hypothetical protein